MPEFREHVTQPITIAAGETQSDPITIDVQAFGCLIYPAALTGTTLYIEVLDQDMTWHRFADSAGDDLTLTFAADKCVRLPDEVFAAHTLRLVADSTQAADREFEVQLKS